jgi:hypothetical protein
VAFLSTRTWQFTYFARQLGEATWHAKDVLDFGGNKGNILKDPNATIDLDRYWCVDVVKDAIEMGKKSYPTSHWIFYDRFCFYFNPCGVPRLPLPRIEQRFDYIVAYSVFTNTLLTDMIDLVGELQGLLKDSGTLAFSFIDPHYHSWPGKYNGNNLRWRLERNRTDNPEIDCDTLERKASGAQWCVLVNDLDIYLENEEIAACRPELQKSCHVFYTEEFMRRLFPNAAILRPVNNEMQHCCVIRASNGAV